MKIDYKDKNWKKARKKVEKILKDFNNYYDIKSNIYIREQENNEIKDFVRLYGGLSNSYKSMAETYYITQGEDINIIKWIYLSGYAKLLAHNLIINGYQTKYNNMAKNILSDDLYLYELIAVDQLKVKESDSNIICLLYQHNVQKAKQCIENLPTNDRKSVSYYRKETELKPIFESILYSDEKQFNDEILRRIKTYRKNMEGYETYLDIISIALIKVAKSYGIKCDIDVIEIPKIFFENKYNINKENISLPYYSEYMNLNYNN